ncbi:hypothetical protein NHP21005_14050 [Helicobacter sp. NHP21005]|uniref:hypothetical protein n=1 Tax=Helicobacter felistomachi TaxID=3040201 RepID=UPI002573D5E6|nr:hypothetical protein [Helicobacter sp. NHP21005]BEG57717.1 hypothetical protein NHP21005_14050 [Helicobacter sp. NHP21005]
MTHEELEQIMERFPRATARATQTSNQAPSPHNLSQKQKDDLINELLALADKLKGE